MRGEGSCFVRAGQVPRIIKRMTGEERIYAEWGGGWGGRVYIRGVMDGPRAR